MSRPDKSELILYRKPIETQKSIKNRRTIKMKAKIKVPKKIKRETERIVGKLVITAGKKIVKNELKKIKKK